MLSLTCPKFNPLRNAEETTGHRCQQILLFILNHRLKGTHCRHLHSKIPLVNQWYSMLQKVLNVLSAVISYMIKKSVNKTLH